jgi:osmotically-inducible protein OsmY
MWQRTKITIPLLICVLLLQGCAEALVVGSAAVMMSVHDRRSTAVLVTDQNIETIARRQLSKDRDLQKKGHINVTSFNRNVLVTGRVENKTLRDRAIRTVEGISGVQTVRNEIAVVAPALVSADSGDSLTTAKVKTRLFTNDFDATRVKVVSDAGRVYLMGVVTRKEGDEAMTLAGDVGGVQKVVDVFEYMD